MPDALFPWPPLLAFIGASLALSVTPGPGVIYILTRTLAQGRRAGLASVAGVALGNLGNALAASLGLAALFAISSLAFTVVKVAGAAYLVWLGLQALCSRASVPASGAVTTAPPLRRIFGDGFLVALLNPKTGLFFAAFLPQFIDPAGSALLQSGALGALFVAIAACTDAGYVVAAGAAGPWLSGLGAGRAWPRYLAAGTYFGLAAYAVTVGPRASAER